VDFIRGVVIISDRNLRMPLWPAGRVGVKSSLMRWGVTWQSISFYACIGFYSVFMQRIDTFLSCPINSDRYEVGPAGRIPLVLLQAQSAC
jgi:hypothetical protein